MTHSPHVPPLPLPLSALLPPCSPPGPSNTLPSPSAAVLGPLPPTTPLHLALNWLALSDLPEYEDPPSATGKGKGRVLIVTGKRERLAGEIAGDDEDWLRERGGDYGVLHRLKRVDMRYCPTAEHALLLLTLLNAGSSSGDAHTLRRTAPGLVILWDLARLFMEEVEEDEENMPPARTRDEGRNGGEGAKLGKGEMKFRNRVALADYMQLINAAQSAIAHFSSSDPSNPSSQLIVLEPHLDRLSSLPILHSPAEGQGKMNTPMRERRVGIAEALAWVLGDEAVGDVQEAGMFLRPPRYRIRPPDPEPIEGVTQNPTHHLRFPQLYPHEAFGLRKRRCGRSEYATMAAVDRAVLADEGGGLVPDVEGDRGGWRWEWDPS